MKKGFHLVVLALFALILWPSAARANDDPPPSPPASADAPPPDATTLKRRGDDAMDALRFDEAVALYKRAYEAGHEPAVLYNLGRAYEAMTDYPHALDHLVAFEAAAPPDLRARVPGLAARIADLRTRVTTLVVRVNVEGARVTVQNTVVGTSPVAPYRTRPGHVVIEVTADGYRPFRAPLDVVGGKDYVVDAHLFANATSGILVVRSPQIGASVEVDGAFVGQTPVETVVPKGERRVVLKKEGFLPSSTAIVVGADERKEVEVPLEAKGSVLSKWWFWTGVAVVVAGGVVAAVALTTERDPTSGTYPPGRVSGPLVIGF